MAEAGVGTIPILPNFKPFHAGLAAQQKSIAGRFAAIGKVASVAMLAGTAAAVVGLGKLGQTFKESHNTIRVGTGATGEALQELQKDFHQVLKGVPASFDDASTAVADLNTRLGLSGTQLQIRSKQFLELSRITGTDVSSNIASVTRVFGDWGISADKQTDTMNQLFRASQATGIGVDTLATKVVKFGAPMRQMGFSFEESISLLGKFEKEGVNGELVMGSLRIALGKLAKDGKEPVKAFRDMTKRIKETGDAGEANALALELFGSRAGPDMAAAIREGRFELGDLLDTVKYGQETIMQAGEDTRDFGEIWTQLKNNVFVALEPIATRMFAALTDGLTWIVDNGIPALQRFKVPLLTLASVIGGLLVTAIGSYIATLLAAAAAQIAVLAPTFAVAAALAALVAGVVYAYQNFEGFRDAVTAVANQIRWLFSLFRDALSGMDMWMEGTSGAERAAVALGTAVRGIINQVRWLFSLFRDALAGTKMWMGGTNDAEKAAVGFGRALRVLIGFLRGPFLAGVQEAARWLIERFGEAVKWFKTIWPQVQEAVTHVMNVVSAVVTRVMTVVLAVIRTTLSVISAVWKAVGDDLLRFARHLWDAIYRTVANAIRLVQQIIHLVLALINGDWGRAWDAIKKIVSIVWDQMRNVVSLAANAIRAVIAGALSLIGTLWRNAWSQVFRVLRETFDAARNLVASGIGWIRDRIASVLSSVRDLWNRGWSNVAAVLRMQWAAMRSAVSGGINDIIRFFRELPHRIGVALGSLGSVLVGKGKDLVNGFVRGIRDAAKRVGSAVGGVVKDAVSSLNPFGDAAASVKGVFIGGKASGGKALQRVQSVLGRFPGARVTSTYRSPEHNRRVGGSATSHHMDRNNPAVDIGGPTAVLDKMAIALAQMGGWRQLLWRVKGHYDHIHVAHQGGTVSKSWPTMPGLRADERPAILQTGERVLSRSEVDSGGSSVPTVEVYLDGELVTDRVLVRTGLSGFRQSSRAY